MKITIFSSNQPRHLHLAKKLSSIADNVYLISEVSTVFPGRISDFYKKSKIMQSYFENVISAEKRIFGDIGFLPSNVKQIAIKSGDLNHLSSKQINEALYSDFYVVFGASYIKGWLIDFLLERDAMNIHMGLSPYYRGSSCNFWALYDRNPSYVGATIHMLDRGLDSGEILFHCIPKYNNGDSTFDYSMRAAAAAHIGLLQGIQKGDLLDKKRITQNKNYEIRYTKNSDFTDEVASGYLDKHLEISMDSLEYPDLINPFIF